MQCQPGIGSSGAVSRPGGEGPDGARPDGSAAPSEPDPAQVLGWSRFPLALSVRAVWGSARDDVWVGSRNGSLQHFDGRTFSSVPSPTQFCIRSLAGSGRSDVWAVATDLCPIVGETFAEGRSAEILHWDGTAWSRVLSRNGELTAVTASAPDSAWAVGFLSTAGFIMKWDGTSWQEVPPRLNHMPTALWSRGSDDVWMGSSRLGSGPHTPLFQHWDGTMWQQGSPQDTFWLCGVWSSGPSNVWALGVAGTWHWDGSTWIKGGPKLDGASSSACAIWGSGPDDVWAAGSYTMTHWNGQSWAPVYMPIEYATAIWGSGPGDVWLTTSAGLFHYYQP